MIVNIRPSGQSFKGAMEYLMHDKNAQTNERVAWTHTENLANDFVPAAVDEMLWTYRDAELLKVEAGLKAGRNVTEGPVKHITLNWHPDDNPSQKHMIDSAKHYLKDMGWEEHQAIFVAHNDKHYKHLHIILNEVHPEIGRKLDAGFEKRRAQKWAAAYEMEQGIIRCEQRLLSPEERQQNMPRNIWVEFQRGERQFEKSEAKFQKLLEFPESRTGGQKSADWEAFKEIMKDQRLAFIEEGRKKFNEMRTAVYREVREEFRPQWSNYYREEKHAVRERQALPGLKASITARQKEVLTERRSAAMKKLEYEREAEYDKLKTKQRETRAEFRSRVNTGLDNTEFLQSLRTEVDKQQHQTDKQPKIRHAFKEAAEEVTARDPRHKSSSVGPARQLNPSFGMSIPGKRRALAMGGSILDSLFRAVTLGAAHESEGAEGFKRDEFEIAAEEATKRAVQEARDVADEDWRKKQKESWRRWDREYYRD